MKLGYPLPVEDAAHWEDYLVPGRTFERKIYISALGRSVTRVFELLKLEPDGLWLVSDAWDNRFSIDPTEIYQLEVGQSRLI